MAKQLCYVLFDSVQEAMAVYQDLLSAGYGITLAPTPREASLCCGVCVLLKDEADFDEVKKRVITSGAPYQQFFQMESKIDTSRNKFC